MFDELTVDRLRSDILFVLKYLFREDANLIEVNTNERCIAARFFAYMMNHTAGDKAYAPQMGVELCWDSEYNRQGDDPKTDSNGIIIPDLILHHRGDNQANICVIEFKKSAIKGVSRGTVLRKDFDKLAYMTGFPLQYRMGVEVILGKDSVRLVWFKDGGAEPFSCETYLTATWKLQSFLGDAQHHERRRSCTLMVTRNCNLHCTYCYEPYKCADKSKEMSFATAKEILLREFEFVLSSPDFDEIEIDFMGGEPLMNFPLIKQVVEWLEQEPPPVPYICFATTNGTLVAKHKKWLRDHAGSLQLGGSYDGTLDMQRVNRGTGEAFENNIELMHEIYPNQGFHMVISKETLPSLADGVLEIQRKGYVLEAALAQGVDWTDKDAKIYRRELEKLARAYLGKDRNLTPINLLTRPLATIADDPRTVEQKKFCGTGTHMVTYDYDGKAYGCHLFTPVVLGDRATEISKIDYACDEANADPYCADCPIKGVCPTCPGFNFRYRGSLGRRDHRWCTMMAVQMKVACVFQIKKFSRMRNFTEDELSYCKHALEAWPVLQNFQPRVEKERR